MSIEILDCTLRDGGYVNNWDFSNYDITGITKYLNLGKVDKIELGYLTEKLEENGTMFNSFDKIKKIDIPNFKKIIMINFGEFAEEKLPMSQGDIFGIRIVFKKSQWKEALDYSLKLKNKGYKIFLQPMQTISYKDIELLEIIEEINKINPYALYIVDSFGEMKKEDLLRIVSLYSHNLNKDIKIGFHSHNNLQLSFALAIEFINTNIEQNKIIDSSVYGMGRGAGNLNTELLAEHLNKYFFKDYEIESFLKIMDFYLEKIYQKEKWGYNLGHFISAKLGCHPNYASYLLEKRNIGVETIKKILKEIPEEKKNIFNREYLEKLYLNHQMDQKLIDKKIDLKVTEDLILIGPGISVLKKLSVINKFLEINKSTRIAINHKNKFIDSDYLFFGNDKRFEEYLEIYKTKEKIIATSNIRKIEDVDYLLDYSELTKNGLNQNSLIIFLNYIEKIKKIKRVYLIGFDGYTSLGDNYYYETCEIKNLNEENEKMSNAIKGFEKEIIFITESKYIQK
ncbi:aldolase catalytic domain-containing protein [Cetobacterium sp.]|uniref:aldolase catalytic domain-containing protein n=1 Tax=Cetobacterium sp. TaxID=2071632 RepID=UPI003F2F45C3